MNKLNIEMLRAMHAKYEKEMITTDKNRHNLVRLKIKSTSSSLHMDIESTSTGRIITDIPMTDSSLHMDIAREMWSVQNAIFSTTIKRNKLIKRQSISKNIRKVDRQLVIDQLTKDLETMHILAKDLESELELLKITGL